MPKEPDISKLLLEQEPEEDPCSAEELPELSTDRDTKKLLGLPLATDPQETGDTYGAQVPSKGDTGSGPGKPDFSPGGLLPESTSACFNWIPGDPVEEDAITVRALNWDSVE
ncbi:hypothetical protein UY3_11868 [Chelonia mydas]|uniref:Uncharacterized protein n=1 Tax=Chelonia mydas TaxID=8469 RepID=M7BSB9_CHEMY|nr:hypothetical protein UY3_11868 [Chelonia mydas]